MAAHEFTLPKLALRIATEADAYRFMEQLRWEGGQPPACPHCGEMGRCYYLNPANGMGRATRTGKVSQRRVWKCGGCRKQFSVLTGTIFEGTRVPLRTWVFVVVDLCSAKNGMSAREVERKYGVTVKTAWFMLHRLRHAMELEPLAGLLRGTVQVDETWIGGAPKNRHAKSRRERERAAYASDKTPVVSIVHFETREVRSQVLETVNGKAILPAVRKHLAMEKTYLHTDAAKAYNVVAPHVAKHEFVTHKSGEYVRDGVSTNLAEGYFSQLKRSIDGTHHNISVKHMDRYLANFDFMYSTCRQTDDQRVRRLIRQVDGYLSYKQLIGRVDDPEPEVDEFPVEW